MQSINKDINALKEMMDNIEVEQNCLKELLHDEQHWMGSVNGTLRKLMHCSVNLELLESKLQKQTEHKTILNLSILQTRSRENSGESSKTSSTPKSKSKSSSTSGDKILDVTYFIK